MTRDITILSGGVKYHRFVNSVELRGREGAVWYYVWRNFFPHKDHPPVCAVIQRRAYLPEGVILDSNEQNDLQLAFLHTRAYARARSHEY